MKDEYTGVDHLNFIEFLWDLGTPSRPNENPSVGLGPIIIFTLWDNYMTLL